jgi:hypothetical protein
MHDVTNHSGSRRACLGALGSFAARVESAATDRFGPVSVKATAREAAIMRVRVDLRVPVSDTELIMSVSERVGRD